MLQAVQYIATIFVACDSHKLSRECFNPIHGSRNQHHNSKRMPARPYLTNPCQRYENTFRPIPALIKHPEHQYYAHCNYIRKSVSNHLVPLEPSRFESRLRSSSIFKFADKGVWILFLVQVTKSMVDATVAGFIGSNIQYKILHRSMTFRHFPILNGSSKSA